MTLVKRHLPLAILCLFVLCDAAFAQTSGSGGGLSTVNTLLQTIETTLNGISVGVCVIAIIWCGYKFMFMHAQFMDLVPIIGGALLIAGATQIANMILGGSGG
ncbi:TrbC/VirB2 family protein [Methylovirgula sp. 4M-Z18]|uniref:TrbC/VirB2 family protein n=1 Tax=Methylovirgula sp. 4M-Z18 TaxID=2293567 RepID=UPI000E2EBEDA|nr:TrbC/VirB2 family protein [Methylovirgula sp. 4M-Z18]RFB76668.1 type IV secretion system protein VirB2 [Methylovirgula sp. 4M-Z18]